MQRKRLVKSALLLVASSGLLLTQGCDEEDVPAFVWAPVIRITTAPSGMANAPGNTGGQAANNPMQNQSLSGLARTGISGNQVAGAGVP